MYTHPTLRPSTLQRSACSALLLAFAAGASAAPPLYTVTDLGTLGGEGANGFGINNNGQCVGQAEADGFSIKPFLWTNGTMMAVPGLLPSGGGRADGVNDHGHVVGSAMAPYPPNPNFSVTHAFFYSPELGPIDLTPTSTAATFASAINNAGQIVGAWAGGPMTGARLWTVSSEGEVTMTAIALPGAPQGFSNEANDINENGLVVGVGYNAAFQYRAWKWQDAGDAIELPILGGTQTIAYGVNDHGQIVGSAQPPFGPHMPVLWHNDSIQELGLLDHPQINTGAARSINNHGRIVGTDYSTQPGVGVTMPWIWIDGVKYALNESIAKESQSEWNLTWAFDINDAGQIVGMGLRMIDGEEHVRAFLLTPVSDAIPGDLNGDGSVGVPDLLILLAAWGPCPDCPATRCPADLDGNCSVGVSDLLILLANWG